MISYLDVTPALIEYVRSRSPQECDVLRELRERTSLLPEGVMQVPPEQGQFLRLLARLVGARRILEVGVFTGYSTLCLALATPPGGTVVGVERDAGWISLARPYWARAGVADRIDIVVGDAAEVLDSMCVEPFDLVFIDADKERYDRYYEAALRLARPGGLIVLDNTLHYGRVVDPEAPSADPEFDRMRPQYRALDALNRKIAADRRVEASLLPAFDGLTLCRVTGDEAPRAVEEGR